MKRDKKELLRSENGFTLIEVLAALVIISIIIGPFLTMYIQSANTNRVAQTMVDANYVAQKKMEHLYYLSETYEFSVALLSLKNEGFTESVLLSGQDYRYSKTTENFHVSIEFMSSAYSGDLVKALVKVYDTPSMKLEAQMETILLWRN